MFPSIRQFEPPIVVQEFADNGEHSHWKHDKKHLNFKGGKTDAKKDALS